MKLNNYKRPTGKHPIKLIFEIPKRYTYPKRAITVPICDAYIIISSFKLGLLNRPIVYARVKQGIKQYRLRTKLKAILYNNESITFKELERLYFSHYNYINNNNNNDN